MGTLASAQAALDEHFLKPGDYAFDNFPLF